MQIAEALIDVYRNKMSCGVDFHQADKKRAQSDKKMELDRNGFSGAIPSLSSGLIEVRSPANKSTLQPSRPACYGFRYGLSPPKLSVTLAVMDTVLYEQVLRTHLWPHLEQYSTYMGPSLDDTLVLYMRSDDAKSRMMQWFPDWKPKHMASNCSLFDRCIAHSRLKKILVVTRVADGPQQHPQLAELIAKHGNRLRVQSSSLSEDFATMVHARHLCMDFSTVSFVAALLNQNLRTVYMPRIFDHHDLNASDDLGWTLPATAQRAVYYVKASDKADHSLCPAPVAKPLSPGLDVLSFQERVDRAQCESLTDMLRFSDCSSRKRGRCNT